MMLTNLGKYIEIYDERNQDRLDASHVVGISTSKEFIETKAKLDGVNLQSYKVVPPGHFAYVSDTSRRGEKISLAYNSSSTEYLVSSISTVFKVVSPEILSSEFLFMYFNRPEFDRFSRFNSWGSARETFSWDDMCDIEIVLPPLHIQEKYVAVYKSMLENQKAYETGLEDLKLVCDATVEKLRREMPCEGIGSYIERGRKNTDENIKIVKGIGQKGFINPQKQPNASLKNYKIVEHRDIVYAPPLYNILSDAIGCWTNSETIVCSPIYEVFKCDSRFLLPEYLMMWLKRSEFKRYAEFHAGGVRNTFDYHLMENYAIPIPDVEIQQSIVDIYNAYITRKEINEKLKQHIKDICPILITGAIKEESANG